MANPTMDHQENSIGMMIAGRRKQCITRGSHIRVISGFYPIIGTGLAVLSNRSGASFDHFERYKTPG